MIQVPVDVPTISPSLYQDAYALRQENKPIRKVIGDDVYLLPMVDCTGEELDRMYDELKNNTFDSWERYKGIRQGYCLSFKLQCFKYLLLFFVSTSSKNRSFGLTTTHAAAVVEERNAIATTA